MEIFYLVSSLTTGVLGGFVVVGYKEALRFVRSTTKNPLWQLIFPPLTALFLFLLFILLFIVILKY